MPEPITLAPIAEFDASTASPDQHYLVQEGDDLIIATYDDGWKDDDGDEIDDVIGYAGPFNLLAVPEDANADAATEDGEAEAA
jgi:hypothetical protein